MTNPKVSVIIPCFNGGKFIERAINSVLNQTFQDFEIIVVDDGSIDNSKRIIRNFRDKRIKYLQNKKNMGISFTRNRGIEEARGEYLAFLDCDDYWAPRKLEESIKALVEESMDLVFSDYFVIDNGRTREKSFNIKISKNRNKNVKNLLLNSFIGTLTVVLKKSILKDDKFNEKLKAGTEDLDLWLRLCLKYDIYYIKKLLSVKVNHQGNKTSNFEAMHLEVIEVYKDFFKKHAQFRKYSGRVFSRIYFSLANHLNKTGDFEKARIYYNASFKAHFNLKYLAGYFLSFFDGLRSFYNQNKKETKISHIARKIYKKYFCNYYELLRKLVRHNTFDFFNDVEIETITRCNRKCSYCPNSVYYRGNHLMDIKLFKKIIDELSNLNYDGIIRPHFYGEPLLDNRLVFLIKYIRKKIPKASIEIYTNGDFLTIELFKLLIKEGVNLFKITQHGESHSRNMLNLVNFLKSYPSYKSKVVYRKLPLGELSNRGGLVKVKTIRKIKKCNRLMNNVIIDYQGNVILCCEDFLSTIVFGNLKKESLLDIWKKPCYKNARRDINKGKFVFNICKNCMEKCLK